MMSIEPRNEPRMLRWFRRTYPSYNLQPLLLKRYRETGGGRSCATVNEDTPGAGFNQRPRFEQVVGYLERNEPLLDQPDRKATSFVTSHFYLDDFVQSNLAGDPEAGALASNGQGRPPSRTACAALQTALRRQRTHRRRGRGARSRAGLPLSAPLGRSGVRPPMYCPGPAQPPPQIIGRPKGVERGAEAIEAAAVAARRERWRRGRWRPPRARLLERWLARRELAGGNGGAGRGHCGRRSLRPGARHGLGAGERSSGPRGQRGRGRAGLPVRQQHE